MSVKAVSPGGPKSTGGENGLLASILNQILLFSLAKPAKSAKVCLALLYQAIDCSDNAIFHQRFTEIQKKPEPFVPKLEISQQLFFM